MNEAEKSEKYLKNIIKDYLQNRNIKYGNKKILLLAAVPQGSVLGPFLWNTVYDGVLKIRYGQAVEPVASTDDFTTFFACFSNPNSVCYELIFFILCVTSWTYL